MLIEFRVGNYKSFKETVTLSMVAAKITAKDKKLDSENAFSVNGDLSLLKSAAIYGANASGKSNLVNAMHFMRRFVLNSSKEMQATEEIPVEVFRLNRDMAQLPANFEIVFLLEGVRYRYGFEVTTRNVVSEWLFHAQHARESRLFFRNQDKFTLSHTFKEGKDIEKKTRSNALFLSVVAQFNGDVAGKLLNWFSRNLGIISGLSDTYRNYTIKTFESNQHKKDILQFVKSLDLDIDDIQVQRTKINIENLPKEMPEEVRKYLLDAIGEKPSYTVQTFHRSRGSKTTAADREAFNLDIQESDGTRKLFALAGPLADTLKNGKTMVIDELDARLHPLITREIIALFNSNKTNPHNAQLIFTTHDTNLLSNRLFRRDQIWFAEKNRQGATDLYSLAEFKLPKDGSMVRNDATFENDYFRGRYGAIPFIGDFSCWIGDTDG